MHEKRRAADITTPFAAREGGGVPPDQIARLPSPVHVLIGVGGLLLLLAVAVVIAVVLVFDLRDSTRLADRNVEYATQLQALALAAKTLANDERGFLLSGDRQFRDQLQTGTPEARALFDSALAVAAGNEQRTAVFEARAGFERWLDLVQHEFAMFRAGDRERAVEFSLRQTRTARHQYEAHLERGQALADSAVESSTQALSSAAWRAIRILLIYLSVALAVGFVVTTWLTRMVVRPVYTLLQQLPPDVRDVRRAS